MEGWDARKMLDKYVLDYMARKNMHTAAEIFSNEANISPDPAVVNPPDGFLTEWWSLFWDVFSASVPNQPQQTKDSSDKNAASPSQRPDMTHMPPSVCPPLPRPDMNYMQPSVCPPPATSKLPDVVQNVYPTMTPRPDMGNMLQNALPAMTSMPELNFNGLGMPPMLASTIGEGQPPVTNRMYENLSEQGRLSLSAKDLNLNARLLNDNQLPCSPPFPMNSGYLQKRVPQKPQGSVLITGRPSTYLGGSSAIKAVSHEAFKLKQPRTEPDDSGRSKVNAHVSSGGWSSSQDGISYSKEQSVDKKRLTNLGGCALADDGSTGKYLQSGQMETGVDSFDDSYIDSFFSNDDEPNDMDSSFFTSPQSSLSHGEFQRKG